ncbi:MAG: permease [Planctomycetes bacterium]|nr:permease [Planctomycetota bacterium]
MSPAAFLALCVGALFLGPLLLWVVGRGQSWRALGDGFVLVLVAGLCLLVLLPEALHEVGAWGALAALLGFFIPTWGERFLTKGHQAHPLFFVPGSILLVIHAAIDGGAVALTGEVHQHHGHAGPDDHLALYAALLAHRLPVGLLVWSALGQARGTLWALAGLVVIALATVVGFVATPELSPALGAYLAAVLAGGLLHVVLHHEPCPGKERWGALGALLGVGTMVPLLIGDPHLTGFVEGAVELLAESGWAIVFGFAGAGALSLVSPERLTRAMTGSTALTSALRGVVLGLPIPICSCGVVPLFRTLMGKGVPPAAAVAFLISTPELGFDAVLLSVPLLGVELTVIRVVAAFAVALISGLVAGWLLGPPEPQAPEEDDHDHVTATQPAWQRAARYGFVTSVDELMPWIAAGIALAAALQPWLSEPSGLSALPPEAQVPMLATLAAPIYVCASGATPIAGVLFASGISAGAVVAFLIAGPATNVTTYGAVRAFFSRKSSVLLLGTVFVVTVGVGFVALVFPPGIPPLSKDGHGSHGVFGLAGALGCALLFLPSLFRMGPRGYLERLGLGVHDHDHGPPGSHHGHDGHDGHGHAAATPAPASSCCAPTSAAAEPPACC